VEFQSREYWELVHKRRTYSHAQGTKFGRKEKLAKLGYTREDLWGKYRYWEQRPRKLRELVGKTGAKAIYQAIAQTISKERRTTLSPKTVERWFKRNPIPTGFKQKKKLKDTEQYQRFLKRIRGIKNQYPQGVNSLYKWMKEKHPRRADDPTTWTVDDVTEWIQDMTNRGYSTNTLRGYMMGIRRFWELGLERPPTEIGKLHLGRPETQKKKPERIDFFTEREIKRMQSLVPAREYRLAEILSDGRKIERRLRSSPTQQIGYQLAMGIAADCGARSGGFPDTEWIGEKAKSPRLYEQLFKGCHGLISLRLEDIKFQKMGDQAPPELRGKEIAVIRLHEKMGKVWNDIYLTPETTQLLKHYIRQKHGFEATNQSLDPIDKTSKVSQLRSQFEAKRRSLAQLYDAANSISDPAKRKKAIQRIGLQLLRQYRQCLLFPDMAAKDLHTLMYVVCHRAEKQGQPIKDQEGRPWTVERLAADPHKFHLLRKSFAQNLVHKGVPLELVSDYGVGWSDLSTLKDYYGRPSRERLRKVYFKCIIQGENWKE